MEASKNGKQWLINSYEQKNINLAKGPFFFSFAIWKSVSSIVQLVIDSASLEINCVI